MRYDIFIIDNNIKFENFKEYAKDKVKNVNVSLFSNFEEIIKEIEFVDVLVVHINSLEYFKIIEKYLRTETYTIFIINNNSDLKKITNSKNYNILYEPLDFDKLISKISYYTQNIKEHLSLKMKKNFQTLL